MKFTGKTISEKDSVKKHAEHIKANDIVFATSDGNAFVGDRAKSTAYSHAANYRPALNVFNLKGTDPADAATEGAAAAAADETPEVTHKSLMKLTADKLKAEATDLGVEFESDANKSTIADAILAKLAEDPADESGDGEDTGGEDGAAE